MEEETQDQVQEDTPTEEASPEADSEEQVSEEQSETTEGEEPQPETYKLPDGRELSADEVYEEYNKLLPEFTRRSQRLSEYEKQVGAREARAEKDTEEAISRNELLKNVDPNVKEAIKQIVQPVISEAFQKRQQQADKARQEQQFEKKLDALEEKFPGGNGLPKFDREKVLSGMMSEGNDVYNPEVYFKNANQEAFNDYIIKQAMKDKSGGPRTETTKGKPKKPQKKSPKNWEEAAKSAYSRL